VSQSEELSHSFSAGFHTKSEPFNSMNTLLQAQHFERTERQAGMASSTNDPVQAPGQRSMHAVFEAMDDNAPTLLRDGYPWNDPNANRAIQARNPGAPRLVGWTLEQCSRGGTNAQASGNGHELTFEDRSLGGSLGGTNFGGNKGKGGGSNK
jgi:hypothetical protein